MSTSAVHRINWTALTAKLKPEVAAGLNAFRRRHAELQQNVASLKEEIQNNPIEFNDYRSVLKNQGVVSEAEKVYKSFKPTTYNLSEQNKLIEKQQAVAVERAKKTAAIVKTELTDLKKLLKDIETARPVDQLTVDDVATAFPQLDETVANMVKRHQWDTPHFREKFGELQLGF